MAFDLVWQLGLIVILLVFGFSMGLSLKIIDFSKKNLLKVSICLILISFLIFMGESLFKSPQLVSIILEYNTVLFLILASIMIGSGFFILKKYKEYGEITKKYKKISFITPYLSFLIGESLCILSSSLVLGVSNWILSISLAVIFMIFAIIVYRLLDKNKITKDIPNSLGNLMLFLGTLLMILSFIFPNIVAMSGNHISAINIASIDSLVLVVIFVCIIIIIGIFYFKKNSLFK